MEHLVDHFRDDLVSPIQGEDAVVPEVVIKRPTDVDEIELVIAITNFERGDDPGREKLKL